MSETITLKLDCNDGIYTHKGNDIICAKWAVILGFDTPKLKFEVTRDETPGFTKMELIEGACGCCTPILYGDQEANDSYYSLRELIEETFGEETKIVYVRQIK